MIQIGSYLNVADNSGAKKVQCISLLGGFKQRYAVLGSKILVTVKKLRSKRREFVKAKKGSIYNALIVRVKAKFFLKGSYLSFKDNAVVILNQKGKPLGTRIFGSIPFFLRYTKFCKLISLSLGVVK